MTYVPDEQKLVGHADREKCTERLAQAVATGHLTQAVFEVRRDRALLAVTRADLDRLTGDLPDDRPPALTYRTQVAGNGVPFSPRRWFASIVISVAMIVLPGPVWAAAAHGFNHAPMNGALPIFIIFAGCVLLIVTGIGFMPDSYETASRNGTPGGRNY